MSRILQGLCLGIVLLLSAAAARAQSFDYTFSSTSSTYTELSSATTVASGNDWRYSYFKVPIGFQFTFLNQVFDTISLEPHGFMVFDLQRAIIPFYEDGCKLDSNNAYSTLSYELSGTTGNRVFKLQYHNCGFDVPNIHEYLSYQVWLKEADNSIEIHTGPSTYEAAYDSTYEVVTPLTGLINPMQDWTVGSFLLTGDPASPSSQPVNSGDPLVYLAWPPQEGKVYVFTPSN